MCPGAVAGNGTATATPKPDPTGGGFVPPPSDTCPAEAPRGTRCSQSCVEADNDKCPGPNDCVIADGTCLSAWEKSFAAEFHTTGECVFGSSLAAPSRPLRIALLVVSALATLVLAV